MVYATPPAFKAHANHPAISGICKVGHMSLKTPSTPRERLTSPSTDRSPSPSPSCTPPAPARPDHDRALPTTPTTSSWPSPLPHSPLTSRKPARKGLPPTRPNHAPPSILSRTGPYRAVLSKCLCVGIRHQEWSERGQEAVKGMTWSKPHFQHQCSASVCRLSSIHARNE
jgi:hypothetical protein